MKKLLKIFSMIIGAIIILLLIAFSYLHMSYPSVPPAEELTIDYSQERIERGAYLANHVTVCMDCHSARDFSYFSGPPTPGTLGRGGDRFDHSMGFPGVFYAKNITPTGISQYSDGELYRVITTGVTHDDRAMFPLMPYMYYGKMDPEDIYDIIAYIRSLDPLPSQIPDSEADFPVNLILNTIPQEAQPQKKPNSSDQVAYGAYLVNAGGCIECHTQVNEQGMIIPEKAFAGGRDFLFPNGSKVTSSNITSDPETGIGNWTSEQFIDRFKQYSDSTYLREKVKPGDFNTIMPWIMYSGMKEEDLRAIFSYLKTLPPQKNQIIRFTAASQTP